MPEFHLSTTRTQNNTESRRRFGWTFSTQYNTDTDSSLESNYQDAEEGPSRTKPTESSQERQQVEDLLAEDPDIDSELAASFL